MLGLTHSGDSRTLTWVLTCNMLHVMVEIPHPLHTNIRSTSYIYDVFLYLLLRLGVIRMQPHTEYAWSHTLTHSGGRRFSWFLTWIIMCAMIEAPHPVHTHVRSTSYIYNVF
jgi:hypothetical protein